MTRLPPTPRNITDKFYNQTGDVATSVSTFSVSSDMTRRVIPRDTGAMGGIAGRESVKEHPILWTSIRQNCPRSLLSIASERMATLSSDAALRASLEALNVFTIRPVTYPIPRTQYEIIILWEDSTTTSSPLLGLSNLEERQLDSLVGQDLQSWRSMLGTIVIVSINLEPYALSKLAIVEHDNGILIYQQVADVDVVYDTGTTDELSLVPSLESMSEPPISSDDDSSGLLMYSDNCNNSTTL